MSYCSTILSKGGYVARFAAGAKDLSAARKLRNLCFETDQTDLDSFDAACSHVLIEDTRSGVLVCSFRVLELPDGRGVTTSYSGQYYDLSALADFPGPMIEMGRFCSHPNWSDPDILRLAWGALTRIVDDKSIQMLFGCASFSGTDVATHQDSFAVLKHHHQAPDRWRPRVKAPDVFSFDRLVPHTPVDRQAILGVPPLLRSYLLMGGWVSDHAVIDRDMNTLHVFTGLEISAIPEPRKRLLRASAG